MTTEPDIILTNDNSRVLGVGERIDLGVFAKLKGGEHWFPISSTYALYGSVVGEDDDVEYRVRMADTFSTGGARSPQEGRGRFDLVPFEAISSLAKRFEYGVPRFGERNWERGIPLSRILSSMRRHAHQIGYDFAEDHVGAVLCNAAMFETMVRRIEAGILPHELDDIGYFLNQQAQGKQ